MNKLVWIAFLALTILHSVASWAQADTNGTIAPQGTPITLWMDYTRGDRHYGPDFIQLHRPCERGSCYCSVEFKVISSKENAKEFADYVTSFEHGRVPVVYDVYLSQEGRFLGERFVRVGDWTSDRFHVNDRLLRVGVRFKPSHAGQKMFAVLSTANCFPTQQR